MDIDDLEHRVAELEAENATLKRAKENFEQISKKANTDLKRLEIQHDDDLHELKKSYEKKQNDFERNTIVATAMRNLKHNIENEAAAKVLLKEIKSELIAGYDNYKADSVEKTLNAIKGLAELKLETFGAKIVDDSKADPQPPKGKKSYTGPALAMQKRIEAQQRQRGKLVEKAANYTPPKPAA